MPLKPCDAPKEYVRRTQAIDWPGRWRVRCLEYTCSTYDCSAESVISFDLRCCLLATEVFGLHAKAVGIPREQFQGFIESLTHRKRSTKVSEVAETAAFLASDRGSGMTGTVANLTGGLIVD